ncbi:hypothetical protein DPMN_072068 [Dreissena polymorpha]|uniref:Uncharacterized protein n=1 Tax=Dreissena polymorpha TaxID=45954 RepID=A0A9D4BXG7_DREPO|nr:hypothetical protein DPMN_072068 [Dreissena polymorpha]
MMNSQPSWISGSSTVFRSSTYLQQQQERIGLKYHQQPQRGLSSSHQHTYINRRHCLSLGAFVSPFGDEALEILSAKGIP